VITPATVKILSTADTQLQLLKLFNIFLTFTDRERVELLS